MSSATLVLTGLSLVERPVLFQQVRELEGQALEPAQRAFFKDQPGWVVSEVSLARQLLAGGIGVKSRPAHSRQKLGGVGGLEGETVRAIKRTLLTAMTATVAEPRYVDMHVGAALAGRNVLTDGVLTESLAASSLTMVADAPPGSVDGGQLRGRVLDTWRTIETDEPGGVADDLLTFLEDLLSPSGSVFMARVREAGWSIPQVAEELRAMLLAGWGSTAASVLTAKSLGVAGKLNQPFVMDEVLRLIPPSFMIARTIQRRLGGVDFEPGDTVLISPWLIHRSSNGWERPDEFDVERWRRPRPSPPWFLPFGLGARRCPAASFARAQAAAAGSLLADGPVLRSPVLTLIEGRSPSLLPN